ncbi:MAG: pilus assembly protein TadG-related protein [Hyphomicrobiales bacterium]
MKTFRTLQGHIRRFWNDETGNIAMLTGLAVVAVVFSAGVGIDHMRALNEKATLQKSLDAAAIAGATTIATDPGGAENAALQVFNLNYSAENGINNGEVGFTFNQTNGLITVTATSQIKTLLTSILGREFIPVNALASAQGSLSRVEFILAVDQSDSMRGSKQQALVQALDAFKNNVYQTDEDGNFVDRDEILVGLVPWQSFVNVGIENATNWTRGFNSSAINFNITDPSSPSNLQFNENTDRDVIIDAIAQHDFAEHGFDVPQNSLDLASRRQFLEDNVFDINFPEPIESDDYSGLSWRGCMMARDTDATIPFSTSDNISDFNPSITERTDLPANLDVLDLPVGNRDFRAFYHPPRWAAGQARNSGNDWQPFGVVFAQQPRSNEFRNPNVGCITYETTYLTEDANQIASAIDVLGAVNPDVGGVGPFDDETAHTDSSIGMVWALRMLDPDWASDWAGSAVQPAAFDDNEARKVIILLTDGANGIGSNTAPLTWSPYGDTEQTLNVGNNNQARNALNIRTLRICELAKQLDVEIYTIAFEVDDGNAREMLQNCATPDNGSQTYYFEASADGTALESVFATIATQTRRILLTQ